MAEWWEERTIGEKVVLGIGIGVLIIGAIFLFGLFVRILWNWLMPEIFGLPEITYWQAWGLLILSMILFKDFGSGSKESGSRHDRKRKKKLREYIKEETQADAEAGAKGAADTDSGPGSDGDAGDCRRDDPKDDER